MKIWLKSSPHFFRLIKMAFWLCLLLLVLLAALLPAPLQEPARLATVPNPVKSAWFLLWIQELVSYRIWLIYPLILVALLFSCLPWLIAIPPEKAVWFGSRQRLIALLSLLAFIGMAALTLIGLYFRGENWAFVLPF